MEFDFSKANVEQAISSFRRKDAPGKRRGPFYNDTQEWIFKVDSEGLFKNAVYQGYLDAARTFKGIKDAKTKTNAFDSLARSIQRYFRGEKTFDHSDWCKKFIDDIKKYNEYNARFGQAQKVVNMAFKYLYCCDGAEDYADKFAPCHMPLDKFTLLWFCSETGKYYEGWSHFKEENYNEVQSKIRELLTDHILDKELVIYELLTNKYVALEQTS